ETQEGDTDACHARWRHGWHGLLINGELALPGRGLRRLLGPSFLTRASQTMSRVAAILLRSRERCWQAFAFASRVAGSPENADNRAGLRANSCMTVDRFSMTNILGIKRERLFAAMTREESDASLARAGAQGRYLPAHRHACHQAFARKGGKLIDRAEVTAARAKIRLLQDGRRFEMIGPMTQPLHAMGGSL